MRDTSLFIAVVLLNVFAYFTIRVRPYLFGVKLFKPMIWNFKLSLLPFLVLLGNMTLFLVLLVIANQTGWLWIRYVAYFVTFVGMVIWLLLLPNAGYLITELNLTHRDQDERPVPIWYDIVSVLSFALSGIVNTLTNIVIIQIIVLVIYDPPTITANVQGYLLASAVFLNILVAVGVYLGRNIRFNSWDVLHPLSFFKKLYHHFKKKEQRKDFYLFVLFHATFFMIIYFSLNIHQYFRG